jgi:hypothetical protein
LAGIKMKRPQLSCQRGPYWTAGGVPRVANVGESDNGKNCLDPLASAWPCGRQQLRRLAAVQPLHVHQPIDLLKSSECAGRDQWWYSERFVVITRPLEAAKCSLSSQLFGHIFTLLENLRFPYCCTQCKQTFVRLVCSSLGPCIKHL